jgi:tetratricopeptide (TPR) repeat protein
MRAATFLPRAIVILGALGFGMAMSAKEPFFEGLGSYSRKVTTDSAEAQRYFNQGLAFLHGFNHGAAISSFQEAARLDPKCAMAHWGIALACGPHINLTVMPPPAVEMAWNELKLAQQNAERASPVERDLIEALSHRYADPPPPDRAPLDQAYADAMRTVWQKYPNDLDVGAFFAEAMMDLRPWNQWLEDALNYDEPPGWLIPVRHSLGATLMQNGRYAEAEQIYREDLARLPENGWSLYGLTSSLRAQKKNLSEAAATDAKFKRLWASADTKITSSCLCQPRADRTN